MLLENHRLFYLDVKMSSLDNSGEIASLAVLTDTGEYFHMENSGIKPEDRTDWLNNHIEFHSKPGDRQVRYFGNNSIDFYDTPDRTGLPLSKWLKQFIKGSEKIVFVVDRDAHSWYHFCTLFNGVSHLPNFVRSRPIDLDTTIYLSGNEPSVSRFDFVDIDRPTRIHALLSCKIMKLCYYKAIGKR